MTDDRGYAGIQRLPDANTEFNDMAAVFAALAGRMATVALVEVMGVGTGTVNVKPLVSQTDGAGNGVDHGTIYNVPVFRLQGGAGGMILDPVIGDRGAVLICSHDSSVVKKTRKAALPGSRRRFDWADALYLGGYLNDAPTRYVRMDAGGITLHDAATVTIDAPTVTVAHDLTVTHDLSVGRNLTVAGNTTLGTGATKFVMLADNTPSTTVKAK